MILPAEAERAWLSDRRFEDLIALLKPYDARRMREYEVSPREPCFG